MDSNCRRCGKEMEAGELYCPQCNGPSGSVKTGKIWLFAIIFSALMLVLAGMLLWSGNCCKLDISWGDITGKPAAKINGEVVKRADLRARLNIARRIMERQYGDDIFAGETGKSRMASLKREVLDRMLEERLIAQEARRMGIVVTDETIEQELRSMGGGIYGAGDDSNKMFGENGITRDVLKNHIRNTLTFQALAKAKIARAGKVAQPEAYFVSWLTVAKNEAKVIVYDSSVAADNPIAGGGGCCGAGGNTNRPRASGCGGTSGCGSGGTPAPVDARTEKKAGEAALEAYVKTNGNKKGLKARVSDYGCHIQVDIDENGKVVKSYTYRDGNVYEI